MIKKNRLFSACNNFFFLSAGGIFQQPGKVFCCPPVRIREMIPIVPFKAAGDALCPDNGMKLPDAVPDGGRPGQYVGMQSRPEGDKPLME